jgi:hypothetical protein
LMVVSSKLAEVLACGSSAGVVSVW